MAVVAGVGFVAGFDGAALGVLSRRGRRVAPGASAGGAAAAPLPGKQGDGKRRWGSLARRAARKAAGDRARWAVEWVRDVDARSISGQGVGGEGKGVRGAGEGGAGDAQRARLQLQGAAVLAATCAGVGALAASGGLSLNAAVPDLASAAAVLDAGKGNLFKGLTEAFLLVSASEIGDKSFFVTALMALRYGRALSFWATMLALTLMSVVAAGLGQVMGLLPPELIKYGSATLLAGFGVQFLNKWRTGESGWASEEKDAAGEVEDFAAKEAAAEAANAGSVSPTGTQAVKPAEYWSVFWKIFVLIFFAEWGDRSMIATMTCATQNNVIGVLIGATLANGICSGIAVIGAALVARAVSERTVNLIAGALFEVFAVLTILED